MLVKNETSCGQPDGLKGFPEPTEKISVVFRDGPWKSIRHYLPTASPLGHVLLSHLVNELGRTVRAARSCP